MYEGRNKKKIQNIHKISLVVNSGNETFCSLLCSLSQGHLKVLFCLFVQMVGKFLG